MKNNKSEFILRHITANLVIATILFAVCFACFYRFDDKTVALSNKEYNGTIYAGDPSSKNVSLMINVYWGDEYLEKMLDTFKEENIKTTFFIGGSWAKSSPELLKRIYNEGHEIASHGYNHKEHGKISFQQNLTEIETCHEIVKHILGVEMELFAPPGGSYSQNTIKAAGMLGYKTIMWTRDTIDWRDKNADLIFNRATTNMAGGDLILMHPTEATSQALTKIISFAKSNGFNLTKVSETLGLL